MYTVDTPPCVRNKSKGTYLLMRNVISPVFKKWCSCMHCIRLFFLQYCWTEPAMPTKCNRFTHGKSEFSITLLCNYPSKICTFILMATEEKDADALQKLQRHLVSYIKSSNLILFPVFAIPAKAKTACFDFLTAFVRYS